MQNTIQHPSLLADIERFLEASTMGVTYFGKVAAGDSSIVLRLRKGGAVSPRVERRVRDFISARQQQFVPLGRQGNDSANHIPDATPSVAGVDVVDDGGRR
jgi:hypothetical protein